MKDKIVICMPVKNAEKTLRAAIESVLHQKKCERELILLIGNDNSSDTSTEIISEYLAHVNVISLNLHFGKVSAVRNYLNDYARNNIPDTVLIGRLDADDVLNDEEVIFKINSLYNRSKFDALICGNKQSRNGKTLEWVNRPSRQLLDDSFLLNQLKELSEGNPEAELPSCNTFIRPSVNVHYPDKKSAEDHWFTVLLLLNKSKYSIHIDDEFIYSTYSLDGATTSQNKTTTDYLWERKSLYAFAMSEIKARALIESKRKWCDFIQNEGVSFQFRNTIKNKDRLEKFWQIDCPVHKNLKSLIEKINKPHIKLLDAGCGPFPKSGICHNGVQIERTLVDALGETYHQMLLDFNIDTSNQRILSCELENLENHIPISHYDIVFAKNCIDHTYNPINAIKSLMRVTMPGGFVYLEHYVNEGEYTGYFGLHQWNISLEGKDPVVSDRHGIVKTSLTELVAPCSLQAYSRNDKVYALIKKDE